VCVCGGGGVDVCVFECNLAQHAWRMRCIVICGLTPPHFWTLSHKRHNFRGGGELNIKRVFWVSLQLHIKYSLFLSDFNGTWIFSADFRKPWHAQCSRATSSFIIHTLFWKWQHNLKNSHYFKALSDMPICNLPVIFNVKYLHNWLLSKLALLFSCILWVYNSS
jgi:hypothetical protein